MRGIVTRNSEELEWAEFERAFYEVKDVTGRQRDPVGEAINMIACHGDTVASQEAGMVPLDEDGRPATPERADFEWGYVCPTHAEYRAGLLDIVSDCASANPDVRLDDVGFPASGYCHCERCEAAFRASERTDRLAWRADVITDFLEDARDRIPGRFALGLYPDPYPGHLRERNGIDLERIEPLIDEFVVPIYDVTYATTYWLEILANGFADALETPFGVELYASQVEISRLVAATEAVAPHADHVYYGYDAGVARAVIRRQQAETQEGVTYGQPSDP